MNNVIRRQRQMYSSKRNNIASSACSSTASLTGLQEHHHQQQQQQQHDDTNNNKRQNNISNNNNSSNIKKLKLLVLLFFTLTATGVILGFHFEKRANQKRKIAAQKQKFEQDSSNILAAIGKSIDSTLSSADAFVIDMISIARATNQSWPFVTIPNFYVRAKKLLCQTNAIYVNTYHYVTIENRIQWETYTKEHSSQWINESIDIQNRDKTYQGPTIDEEFLSTNYTTGHYDLIHGYDEYFYGWENGTTGVSNDSAPYLPWWQCAPVIPVYPLYNWDLTTTESQSWSKAMETGEVVLTEPYMIADPDDYVKQEENLAEAEWISDYLEPGEEPLEPISDIYYPILEHALDSVHIQEQGGRHQDHNSSNFHGLLSLTIYWRDMLRDLLPEGSDGVGIVFENSCSPSFSYHISGPEPIYLGTGDHNHNDPTHIQDHEDFSIPGLEKKVSLMDVWDFGVHESSYTGIPFNEDVCPFTLRVYPASKTLHEMSSSDGNSHYHVMLVLIFVAIVCGVIFTFIFFFVYDRFVRKEFQAKRDLLDAKSNFVRFISHEVRTPLNTVNMGLKLLHDDLSAVIMQQQQRRQRLTRTTGSSNSQGEVTYTDYEEDIAPPSLLEVEASDISKWSGLTQEVMDSADIAVGVLNDLLNIDKINTGKLKLELQMLSIWDLVEEVYSEFHVAAAEKEVDLRIDYSGLLLQKQVDSGSVLVGGRYIEVSTAPGVDTPKTLPKAIRDKIVVGDYCRLSQAIRNLFSNALKFSPKGNVTVKLSAKEHATEKIQTKDFVLPGVSPADCDPICLTETGMVVVDVIDSGVGMTSSQIENVFEVGTQFNVNVLQGGGGSGLGLSFARAIVRQHGGELDAKSDGLNRGTTFSLTLPLYEKPQGLEGMSGINDDHTLSLTCKDCTDKTKISVEENFQCRPLHILVVDDVASNRKMLIRLLEKKGHICYPAIDGQEAVDCIISCLEHKEDNHRMYDCILMDNDMPKMDGPTACRKIRDLGCSSVIVGITGKLLKEDVRHFKDCGADDVLPKPFKLVDLESIFVEHGITKGNNP